MTRRECFMVVSKEQLISGEVSSGICGTRVDVGNRAADSPRVSSAWLTLAAATVVGCSAGFSEYRRPDFSSNSLRCGTVVVLPLTVAESELQIPWPIRESASSSACAKLRDHRRDLRIACYAEYEHSPAWPALDLWRTKLQPGDSPPSLS